MRIACPSCAATYEVPASRLRPGKLVRCARCANDWLPVQQAEPAVPPSTSADPATAVVPATAAPLPAMTAMDRLAAAPASPPARVGLIGAWVLTLIVLAAAVVAIVGWRQVVVRAWPPSARILTTTAAIPTAAKGKPSPLPAQTAGKAAE
jgi:predicted Zn finger-like uncharacterized protein